MRIWPRDTNLLIALYLILLPLAIIIVFYNIYDDYKIEIFVFISCINAAVIIFGFWLLLIHSLFKPFSEKAFDLFLSNRKEGQNSIDNTSRRLILLLINAWRLISFSYFILFTTFLGLTALYFFYLPFSRIFAILLKVK